MCHIGLQFIFCFASVLFIPYIVMSYRPPIYFIFCLYSSYAVSCYVISASVYSYILFFLLSIFTVCCHLISALFVLCPVQYLYHVLCHIGLHLCLVLPVHDLYHVIKFHILYVFNWIACSIYFQIKYLTHVNCLIKEMKNMFKICSQADN